MRKTSSAYFSPVESAGAREAIVRRIGELIRSGELRTGDRLPPEASLAESFRVAPMTVRAALQMLREYGLVETRRGRGGGTFVCSNSGLPLLPQVADLPPREEFEDFTIWRVAVSGEAAARVARRFADRELGTQEASRIQSLAEASHAQDLTPPALRMADAQFHLYIAELARSPRLVEAERSIQSRLTQILYQLAQPLDLTTNSAQSHSPLVTAIVDGQPDEARRCMRIHVQSTVDLLVGLGVLK